MRIEYHLSVRHHVAEAMKRYKAVSEKLADDFKAEMRRVIIADHRACLQFRQAVQEDWVRTRQSVRTPFTLVRPTTAPNTAASRQSPRGRPGSAEERLAARLLEMLVVGQGALQFFVAHHDE
jgi:hypothetical protein